jgi:hypothetical protein
MGTLQVIGGKRMIIIGGGTYVDQPALEPGVEVAPAWHRD